MSLTSNNASLEAILATVNALPEAGGGSTGGTCTVEMQVPPTFNATTMCDFFLYHNGENWTGGSGQAPESGTYTVSVGTIMAMCIYRQFGSHLTFETTGQVEMEYNDYDFLQVFKVNGDGAIIITE